MASKVVSAAGRAVAGSGGGGGGGGTKNTIGTVGKVFFPSLVAGTFGLGCWQTQRYFEKQDMIVERKEQLKQPAVPLEKHSMCSPSELRGDASPVHQSQTGYYYGDKTQGDNSTKAENGVRRIRVTGVYQYEKTVLVGPRGPPPGALAASGPNAGRSSGNMTTSPQGYFLVTPFSRSDQTGTVLVNRGWVPMSMLQNELEMKNVVFHQNKPPETETIEGVVSNTEQPKRFSPPSRTVLNQRQFQQMQQRHETPVQTLLWMDRVALEEDTQTMGLYPTYILQTHDEEGKGVKAQWPAKPTLATVGEFKVSPATHFGYAATWFGLSSCGMIMTRKLLLRR
jgi:surfeit locus 1 family protein